MKKWQIQRESQTGEFWYTLRDADELHEAETIAQTLAGNVRIMHRDLVEK